MDNHTNLMVAGRGVYVDSHCILDGSDISDGSSWNRPTHASYRGQTQNAAERRGFGTGYRRHIPPSSMLYQYHHPAPMIIGHQNLFLHIDHIALLVNRPRNVHMETRNRNTNMSYEELVALGEHVGNVSTGLPDDIITAQLKIRSYLGMGAAEENDLCVICQDEYQAQEKIGVLPCGHEYHADCLRRWLQMKNSCPMCKSEALIAP